MSATKQRKVFIVLGRHGDLILLMPCWRELARTEGIPLVIVSQHYASVFDGISYAEPIVVPWDWFDGMPHARALAAQLCAGAIVPRWWDDTNPVGLPAGPTILQSHGRGWGVDCAKWPCFCVSMWDRAGFSLEQVKQLEPLYFDRRDAVRERQIVEHFKSKKPTLIMSLAGSSSPFGYTPELWRLVAPYRSKFNIVDISTFRAKRIYDLLGLYDVAAAMITIDTSTLWLAWASTIPYVALTARGWGAAVPMGNCQLTVPYEDCPKRLAEIPAILEQWLHDADSRVRPLSATRPGRDPAARHSPINLAAPAMA